MGMNREYISFSPEQGIGLPDRPYGHEVHSPYHLYNFVWSRISNLSVREQSVLANILSDGDNEAVRHEISEIIDLEHRATKSEIGTLLDQFRFRHLQASVEDE